MEVFSDQKKIEDEFNSQLMVHILDNIDQQQPPAFPGEDIAVTTLPFPLDPEMVSRYNVRMSKPKKNWAGKRRPVTAYRQAKKEERMVLATMMAWRKQGFRFKHKNWEVEKEYDSDEQQ